MKKRILCFGDSNTYGLIPGSTDRYPEGIRWTGLVQAQLGADYQIIEEGLCGRTTVFEDETRMGRDGSSILPILLESHTPLDGVILMLGTNDCKIFNHATAEDITNGMEVLVSQVRRMQPNAWIMIISPIYLGEEVWKAEFDPEFNQESVVVSRMLRQAYQNLAQKTGITFLAASDLAYPSRMDQEHLDVLGHRNLAEAVTAQLRQKFEDTCVWYPYFREIRNITQNYRVG